jgi:hypothetical protein
MLLQERIMFEIFTLGALASALIAGPTHPAGAEVEFVAGPVVSKAWGKDPAGDAPGGSRQED